MGESFIEGDDDGREQDAVDEEDEANNQNILDNLLVQDNPNLVMVSDKARKQ